MNGLHNGTAHGVSSHVNGPQVRPLAPRSAGDALLEDSFYPLQKGPYISPNYRLSAQSKKLVRQAQEPVLSSSPATVHLIYEVGSWIPFVKCGARSPPCQTRVCDAMIIGATLV